MNVSSPPANSSMRVRLLLGLALAIVVLGAAAAWWWQQTSQFVTTDNAYVAADVANVMAQTSGTIAEVRVEDTQTVKRGDVLATFDDADARIAVAQAEAEYARVLRHVQQYFQENKTAAAEVAFAQAVLNQARSDLARRTRLSGSGAISAQELSNSQAAYDTAVAALDVARRHQESQATLTNRSDVNSHPEVMAAHAALDAARLALDRTTVHAPIDGIVIQKRVALGQRLQGGSPLLSLVPLEHVYVVANYKEGQLEHVRVGQPVTLTADLYGGDVTYSGRVAGLSGGTGSAFAVIPAQNATGSWIKVVQRLPVRIDLDAAQLRAHPLRVGLSMHVKIDIR